LGYDENGLPFPPEVPGYPFEKAIAPVPSEKVFMTTFPNPFNSFIDIIIYAPKEMDGETVQLIIYDTRGNIVYKTNGKSEKGTALFRWNGSNKNGMHASSGIYFYKVSIWNYSVTGNICYVR